MSSIYIDEMSWADKIDIQTHRERTLIVSHTNLNGVRRPSRLIDTVICCSRRCSRRRLHDLFDSFD